MPQREDTTKKVLSYIGRTAKALFYNIILVAATVITGILTVQAIRSDDFNFFYIFAFLVLGFLFYLVNRD